MPRVREVISETKLLIADMKKRGISDNEILVGIIVATQTEPVTQAISQNPEVSEFFRKIGAFIKSVADLMNLSKSGKV